MLPPQLARPVRVLHLIANRWWTGGADPALDLARSLRRRGHEVLFACIGGDALEAQARAAGLPPVETISLERTARPWVLVRDLRGLRRLVTERRVDLVHAHLTHDHWLTALAIMGTGVRLVRTVHHRRALRRGPAARWLIGRTDQVIAVSSGIAAVARAAGVAADRLAVVGGAVDTARFVPGADGAAVRAELGLGDRPVVGCVARLRPDRGHDVLLRAMACLRARVPELRLLLVGRGEGRPAIDRLIEELDLRETVVLAGYRGPDLPAVLTAMDCFALLQGGSEESCRAALEAMAAGRPVVAGRTGALPDTVVDGETGWVVDGGPEAVAERVGRVLANRTRAEAMGAAGRRRVEALFTSERRAVLAEGVYARALGRS